MAPKRGKKLSWLQILNQYTKDSTERVVLDRLKILTDAIAMTEGRTDLNMKQTKRRQKHIEEKLSLETKILELTDVSAWDHLSALSQLYSTPNTLEEPQSPEENSPVVSVSSTRMASDTLSHKFRSVLRLSDTQFSVQPEFYVPNSQDCSENQTTRQEVESPLSTDLKPSIPSSENHSKALRAKLPPNIISPIDRHRPVGNGRIKEGRDLIVPPSIDSGGIPEPSAAYLSFCNMTPQLSPEPQQLLLVLDLNGTLLFRPSRNKVCSFIERPSTQQFLSFVLENFSVMIWSSARLPNVELICHRLIPRHLRERLVAIWGREQLGLNQADFKKRVQVYKRLDRVWNSQSIQVCHPQVYEGRTWHQGNTVLIDDSKEKSRSEPNNFVKVEEFTGRVEDPNILRDLAEYLATLRMQANVSSYIRQQPYRK